MKIKIYGGNNCRYCTQAVDLLNSREVEFEYANVHEDEDALQKIREDGVRGIPAIYVDDEFRGNYDILSDLLKELAV